MTVKYPKITVKLVGQDGNAFSILGRVRKALQDARVPSNEVSAYVEEASSGDYDHLFQVTMKWVNVT